MFVLENEDMKTKHGRTHSESKNLVYLNTRQQWQARVPLNTTNTFILSKRKSTPIKKERYAHSPVRSVLTPQPRRSLKVFQTWLGTPRALMSLDNSCKCLLSSLMGHWPPNTSLKVLILQAMSGIIEFSRYPESHKQMALFIMR